MVERNSIKPFDELLVAAGTAEGDAIIGDFALPTLDVLRCSVLGLELGVRSPGLES